MDSASLLGIGVGVALLFWAILLGGSLGAFWDLPSVMITLGGTMAATLIAYPMHQVMGVMRVVKKAFVKTGAESSEIINTLVRFAEKARREGLLALEEEAANLHEPFLQKGIQLVVDGSDADLVRSILQTELSFLEERHKSGASMFETMGALSPAFGMIGTLIGLIQMLGNLDRPEMIGPGMAVALITTFYGALLAYLLFIPIAGKLKVRSSGEILIKEVMIEGILSIQAGDNPRIVEEKLKAFLSPQARAGVAGRSAKARDSRDAAPIAP